MIREAIQEIVDLSEGASRLEQLGISNGKVEYYQRNGTLVCVELPIPRRQHVVLSISSLKKAIDRYTVSSPAPTRTASVWIDLTDVLCVLDDADGDHRQNTVRLPVTPSPCFDTLRRQHPGKQKELLKTLRHDLASATLEPSNTIDVLRNLRFATQSEESGKFTATSAAMGKSVEAEVTGQSALPEAVCVSFHPFPALSEEVDVEVEVWCSLFTDAFESTIQLCPRPGELEAAERKAIEALRDAVSDALDENTSGVTVLVGSV